MIIGVTGTMEGALGNVKPGDHTHNGATHVGIHAAHHPATEPSLQMEAQVEVKKISALLRHLQKASGTEPGPQIVSELQSHAAILITLCSKAKWDVLTTFASCLSKLFRLFKTNPKQINASTLRTAANAVDFLSAVYSTAADVESIEKAPLRALVIDDNETCRRAMVLALSAENLQVYSASSGEEALGNLRQNDYDVVLTDIMMPRINGFTVVKLLRALPNHARTPVVFVTALSDFETRSRSILSGGCDLVAKPITPSELLLKAFTFGLRGRFPECRRRTPKAVPALSDTPPITGVLTLDSRDTVGSTNEEAAFMFGYKPAELLGLPVLQLFPDDLQSPENRGRTIALLREANSSSAQKLVACRKNSSLLQLLVTANMDSRSKGTVALLLRYANPVDAPRRHQPGTESPKAPAHMLQPPNPADLNQTLEAIQAQFRLQMEARCSEERQLRDRIVALEGQIEKLRKREACLEEELTSERQLRKRGQASSI